MRIDPGCRGFKQLMSPAHDIITAGQPLRSAFSRTAMNNTHLTYHHKKNINIAVVFLSSLVISVLLAAIFIIASLQNEQVKLQKIAHFYGDHFSQKISTSLQSLSRNLTPLYTMLILHDGRTDHFERVAEHIAHTNPEIININLARNGIVTNVYPYERNKIALGHNLLEAEQRRQEARLARDSRRITLSGPFQLVQGGHGARLSSAGLPPLAGKSAAETILGICHHYLSFPGSSSQTNGLYPARSQRACQQRLCMGPVAHRSG